MFFEDVQTGLETIAPSDITNLYRIESIRARIEKTMYLLPQIENAYHGTTPLKLHLVHGKCDIVEANSLGKHVCRCIVTVANHIGQ